jgi:hypothetical protein
MTARRNFFRGDIMPEPSWTEEILDAFSMGTEALINFFASAMELIFGFNMPVAANAAITTAAVSLATLFFVMQFFSELASFRMDRIEEAIRLAMKVIVAKIILENSMTITNMIYDMFWGLSVDSLVLELGDLSASLTAIMGPDDPGFLGINNILSLVLIFIPSFGITIFVLCSLVLTIAGIFFEVQIHVAVAPLALSTLVNETTRSTGISFIKSYVATCLQLTIISVCVSVFQDLNTLLKPAINELDGFLSATSIGSLINCIVTLLVFVCFSTAIKKSGDLTRRMFGV